MNDPKYDLGKIRHIEHDYIVDPNEPCMLLRGKDVGALQAIISYIQMLETELAYNPNYVINSHLDSSIERLNAFYKYQYENPSLQSVGCSNSNHGLSGLYMKKAYALLCKWGADWE